MNPPENRENIAEIFFETFNVPGLYFGDQAFLSLLGYRKYSENNVFRFDKEQKEAFKSLTGLVVDSGDDITHIIPICDGTVVVQILNIFQ
jgi:actin-related protein 3